MVSRWHLTADMGVRSRAVICGICGGQKMILGQVPLRVLTTISGQLLVRERQRRLEPFKEGIIFRILSCVKIEEYFQLSSFSCRPSTAAALFRFLASQFRYCGKKVRPGQVFLRVLRAFIVGDMLANSLYSSSKLLLSDGKQTVVWLMHSNIQNLRR
jgi:hypothetical protein